MKLTSKDNNTALENLNDNFLEIKKDRGIIATYLLSPLSKITCPETTNQLFLVKDPSSIKVNDLLINKTIPATLRNTLIFRYTDENSEFQGDLLKMITNKKYNVDLAIVPDKK